MKKFNKEKKTNNVLKFLFLTKKIKIIIKMAEIN